MNRQAVRERTTSVEEKIERVEQDVLLHAKKDLRFKRELEEMDETEDLRNIDDDVEDVATLFEWNAHEHVHQFKNVKWFSIFAIAITLLASLTIGMIGLYMFIAAQQKPSVIRYRLMTGGVALNNVLYHYKDLDAFNIIYEPRNVKTVLVRSNKRLAPLIYMEIGDADPVAIRDVLVEFVREDIHLEEPVLDIWARRLKF
jgi:hypothetical protein